MGAVTLRHVRRAAPSGALVQVLGTSWAGETEGLVGRGGYVRGSYTRRLDDVGEFTVVLPNAAGSDGRNHVQRFLVTAPGVLYEPGDEWVEVWDDSTLLFVGTPTNPQVQRGSLQLQGYDALHLLKTQREYFAGYWCHAPRDVFEAYTRVWRLYLAEDFQDTSAYPALGSQVATGAITPDGRLGYSWTSQGPTAGTVRIHPLANGTEGLVRGIAPVNSYEIGSAAADPYEYWQVRANYTRPRFGNELVAPYGDNAAVRVGLWDTVADTQLVWLQLQEKYTYISAPNQLSGTQRGLDVQLQTDPPGPYEIIIEGRERWVYFYVNQALVGCLPMPVGPYTVVPFVGLRSGDASHRQYIDLTNMTLRRTQPWLMRGSHRGDYRLPGAPPPGGLWGRYYTDAQLAASSNPDVYKAEAFSPFHNSDRVIAQRLDKDLNFPHDGTSGTDNLGETVNPPNWQPSGTNLWWSVRWAGAINLPLASVAGVQLRVTTDHEGCRVWIGRTRWGEQIYDDWDSPAGGTHVVGTLNGGGGLLPTGPGGVYEDGWYPVVIEYGNRNVAGAAFRLEWKLGGAAWAPVPSSALSPYGVYDTYDQPLRLESHYDQLQALRLAYGYQFVLQPMSLETGEFPGRVEPRVRVGRDTSVVVDSIEAPDYGTSINTDDYARAVLLDGQGLGLNAAAGGEQLSVEALNYAGAEDAVMLQHQAEQDGSISYGPLLAQRATTYLFLHGSAWEQVTANPRGGVRVADTWPLGGPAALFDWLPGDAARLTLPEIGVMDGSPRQILTVQRSFTPEGRGTPEVGFAQRPRNARAFLREQFRRTLVKQRTWQGQHVATTGTYAQAGTDLLDPVSRILLPPDLSDVVRVQLVVHDKQDGDTPWYVWVNGLPTNLPPVTAPGRYDISAYVGHAPTTTGDASPVMHAELRPTPT